VHRSAVDPPTRVNDQAGIQVAPAGWKVIQRFSVTCTWLSTAWPPALGMGPSGLLAQITKISGNQEQDDDDE
jgi:hypothetical protein